MADVYITKRRDALKKTKTDQERDLILNKIYDDGFEDGCNEGNN